MQFKNGWMAVGALVASATLFGDSAVLAAENECLIVTSGAFTLNASATYGNVIVSSGATLSIAPGVVLTLDGESDGCSEGDHDISGIVILAGSGSVLRFTGIDQFLKGNGIIYGQDNAARIDISSGLTLTNEVTIQGSMVIQGSSGTGSFLNNSGGVVRAYGGTITLHSSLSIDDEDGALWKAGHALSSGDLVFHGQIAELEGDFQIVNCASILFNGAEISTTGTFLGWVGTINFDNGGYFGIGGTVYDSNTTSGGCQ